VKVIIGTPFIHLAEVSKMVDPAVIAVSAQNCATEVSGAYTGEVSAAMLVDLGVEYVIIGHSERRQYFAETDETVNMRTKAALEAGLKVILCVGELEKEREQGITAEILGKQTKVDLMGVTAEQMKNVIIAYEPVWAIGTGKVATTEQADEACGVVRSVVAEMFGKDVADKTAVQYGGSMNAKNCAELLKCENVDGGLIGGASLKSADFGIIVDAAQ